MTTDVNILAGKRLKVGDKEPGLRVQLLDEFGNGVNLDTKDVDMHLRRSDSDSRKIDTDVNITDKSRGIVEYEWKSGETNENGTFLVEFVVTNPDTEQETFPSSSYARIYIDNRL